MALDIYEYFRDKKANYDFHRQLKQDLRSSEILLVHQMGKVGSSAVVASLKALDLDIPLFHTHSLNAKEIEHRLRRAKETGREVPVGSHLTISQHLQKVITKGASKKHWKIITLVREPIARNISAFFQNIDTYFPNFFQSYAKGEITIEQIIEKFFADYPHNRPLQWFDTEIREVFNIDIFSTPFPISAGYQILNHENISLLLIRLEDLNRCFQVSLQEFMDIKSIKLEQENIAVNKNYYEIYSKFKNQIKLPKSYIENMYCSKYVRHFYAEDEIKLFEQKWYVR